MFFKYKFFINRILKTINFNKIKNIQIYNYCVLTNGKLKQTFYTILIS